MFRAYGMMVAGCAFAMTLIRAMLPRFGDALVLRLQQHRDERPVESAPEQNDSHMAGEEVEKARRMCEPCERERPCGRGGSRTSYATMTPRARDSISAKRK